MKAIRQYIKRADVNIPNDKGFAAMVSVLRGNAEMVRAIAQH